MHEHIDSVCSFILIMFVVAAKRRRYSCCCHCNIKSSMQQQYCVTAANRSLAANRSQTPNRIEIQIERKITFAWILTGAQFQHCSECLLCVFLFKLFWSYSPNQVISHLFQSSLSEVSSHVAWTLVLSSVKQTMGKKNHVAYSSSICIKPGFVK